MAKEVLLDHSSGIVRLFLDGEFLKGVISIDGISNIYQKDTAKEIQITLLADKVKVKLPDGEIKDISEMQKVGGIMNDFLKFFDNKAKDFPMHLKITYSKICDWNILIYKSGCADYYPEAKRNGGDVIIVNESDCDMELCFAKAHVKLKEWLLEFNGGY